MIAKATLRYVRISPRKVRPVIALVKGKRVDDALSILHSVKKKASTIIIDLVNSALANAKRVPGIDISELCVSNLIANGGPQLKRFRAASMGRAGMIRKRTSHITVDLDILPEKRSRTVPEGASAEVKKRRSAGAPTKAAAAGHQAVKRSKVKTAIKS